MQIIKSNNMTAQSVTPKPEETNSPTENTALLHRGLDGLVAVGTLGLLPLMWLHCQDLWLRTDLQFFPLLIVVPLIFFAWKKDRFGSQHQQPRRTYCALGTLALAATLAIVAGTMLLPWLAWLAFTLAAIGWMVERLGGNPWYQPIAWTSPWWVLLLLPLSDRTDYAVTLLPWVASSASHALDVLSIPQMASGAALDLKSGLLPLGPICSGLGEPYLLLSLIVILSMLTKRSALIHLLTIVSLPAWIWLGAVSYVVSGALLLEHFDWNAFGGSRYWVAQGIVMSLQLLAIWITQVSLNHLFTPFATNSEGVGGLHRFFNFVVLWPAKDPLRARKSSGSERSRREDWLGQRPMMIILLSLSIGFLLAGGLGLYQMFTRGGFTTLAKQEAQVRAFKESLQASDMPEQLLAMQQRGFEPTATSAAGHIVGNAASWSYVWNRQLVTLTAAWPIRGFYPFEWDKIANSVGKISPRESFQPADQSGPTNVLLDDLTLVDPLYGDSYLGYATLSVDGQPLIRTDQPVALRSVIPNWLETLRLQPTVVSLQLQVIGAGELTDAQRGELRQVLSVAAEQLRSKL